VFEYPLGQTAPVNNQFRPAVQYRTGPVCCPETREVAVAEQDRRIRRTRRVLNDALISLVLEKGYERITVQDILDRADVGRSTFYAHYRDKEALLLANFDDMREELRRDLDAIAPGAPPPDPTSPIGAIFDHAHRNRRVYQALCGKQGGNVVYRHLHGLIVDLLRARLRPHLAATGSNLPVDIVAEFYTSAALGLLTWWIDQNFRYDPIRLTAIYRQLATLGLPGSGRRDDCLADHGDTPDRSGHPMTTEPREPA
jgi:AcrR family transcriptional regulator